jgi:hypothetical protein
LSINEHNSRYSVAWSERLEYTPIFEARSVMERLPMRAVDLPGLAARAIGELEQADGDEALANAPRVTRRLA